MLGTVEIEIAKSIDAYVGKKSLCIWPLDNQLIHMVRLIKQNRRLAPSGLFIAPIGIFWRNHRIDIHADLRIAQHIYCIPVAFDFCT